MISLIKDCYEPKLNLMSKTGIKIDNLSPIELLESSIASCISSYIEEKDFNVLNCSIYPAVISVTYSNKRILIKCAEENKELITTITTKCSILRLLNIQYEVKGE